MLEDRDVLGLLLLAWGSIFGAFAVSQILDDRWAKLWFAGHLTLAGVLLIARK